MSHVLPRYSRGEEVVNAITHGLGAGLAVAGLVLMLLQAADAWQTVSAAVYGSMLILMFMMSCLYHAITNRTAKCVFRVFDHSSVALLIAGTYTPFTLVALRGALGWVMFGIVWASTILSIVFNAINIERFKVPCMVCYLASGWCIIFALAPLLKTVALPGIILLVTGGVAYTAGTLFYRVKNIPYMHSIWHVFVLAGAILHYLCLYRYVLG